MKNDELICIVGPTACGKTSVATRLAARLSAEIISGDSRQVYRGMDIGTGKDLDDYTVTTINEHGESQTVSIPYHLIDIVPAGTRYNLFEFVKDFDAAFSDITQRGKRAILCGGTGLYVESVIKGYEIIPVAEDSQLREQLRNKSLQELQDIVKEKGCTPHNKLDTVARAVRAIEIMNHKEDVQADWRERKQKKPKSIVFGINISRETRRQRISQRLKFRLENGLIEEVNRLLRQGITADDLIYYGLEYKYVTLHCIGKLSYDEMHKQLEIAIHQFAKRQMTWLRGMERRGTNIIWIDGETEKEEIVEEILSHCK